jgi:hypothetical protein
VHPDELAGEEHAPRERMPELEVDERRGNFKEVELGLAEDQARREAERCLNCGLYCFGQGIVPFPLKKIA